MKSAIKWMAANRVSANLLMLVLMVGGLVVAYSIKQEVFPEINLDTVQVGVAYPGAGPEEVEDGVILKIEESLSAITAIKELKSVATEGGGVVTATIMDGEDIDLVMLDVKAEIDRITTFPEEAEKPVISKLSNRSEVIMVIIYGDVGEKSLRENAESVNDDLLSLQGITQTELSGVRPYEISIDISESTLDRYNLTLDQIAVRIRKASIDLPAGIIKSPSGEILIRTKEKRYIGLDYASIGIIEKPDGTIVTLGDLGVVRDEFRETDEYARLDGKRAAIVNVFRVGKQTPSEISKIVKKYVDEKNATLPEALRLTTLNDRSELLKSRMNLLLKNAVFGLVLVFIVLGLFLQIRLAIWVMLGIPISFLGAMIFIPAMDVSINMLSLFAFILALGIVVDDAIVVGENIFDHRHHDKNNLRAAVDGAQEVAGPVIFSVLTTIIAFLPLLFVEGLIGKFIKTIPLVVIPILFISLVESLFILPAHLGHAKSEKARDTKKTARFRAAFEGRLANFINGPYLRLLSLCIRHRYSTLASAIGILLITIGLVGGGVIKFRFMPKVDGDHITASIKMPTGTPVEETGRVHDLVIKKAQELVTEYDSKRADKSSILRSIYSTVGTSLSRGHAGENGTLGSNIANVALALSPSEVRKVPSSEIATRWRNAVGDVPGIESLSFTSNIVRFGANIDIRLAHNDFKVLTAASSKLKAALGQYPGVDDIMDSYSQGKREVKIRLLPEAASLGITESDLASQVRAAFYGAEALRFQRGRDEIKVMLRLPLSERRELSRLINMRLRSATGKEIPFSRAARIEEGRGYSTIKRTDRKRVLNVTANVDAKLANAEEILLDLQSTILEELKSDYPGLSIDLEGEDKERRESMKSLRNGFIVALFAMFALLAVPFRSYSQPAIIMAAIPFGIVGAIIGHIIMGFDLSILSMFGLVALSGVLVNDSLLLVDYINKKREAGEDLTSAVTNSGLRRFRPIILTSLTTSLGLTPMILETSVQAQFLIPMAISLGFGILFATAITLLLIPSLYLILEDIRGLFGLPPLHTEDLQGLFEDETMEK